MPRRAVLAALLLAAPLAAQARAQESSPDPDGPPGYVAVLPPADHPQAEALRAAIEPLLAHRASQGLAVEVLQAPAGSDDPRGWLRERIAARRPAFLLLVGDAAGVPTFVVADAATDRPYADADGDGYPEAAVGRIPWSDPGAVRRVVARTLRYEREAPAGRWQKEVALVAGEAGFSETIDPLIEHLFQQVVAESVHPGYDVDLTYANPRSPYLYPPERLADRVAERLAEGPLLFAYVGHGAERSVDDLDVRAPDGTVQRYPVLDAEHLGPLHEGAGGSASVFFAIACWTGRIDARRPSIGAELLAAPGGPVAFVGASRVSHPIHNALLARELVRELLAGTGPVRLGPALDRARRGMVEGPAGDRPAPVRLQVLTLGRMFVEPGTITAEMPRHVDMYNLFGDPALVLARPAAEVALTAPEAAAAGEAAVVRGRAPLEGARAVTLTLETTRERGARPEGRPGETAVERYARANDRVLATELARVAPDGTFEATLRVPAGAAAGRCVIKAFVAAEERTAVGATPLRVERKARPAPSEPSEPSEPAPSRFY